MDNIEQKKENDKKFIKIINDISVEEINNALKGYDLTGNIFEISSIIQFSFGAYALAICGFDVVWGGALTFLGLGKFGYEAMMYEGISLAPMGLGFILGGSFLLGSSYFFYEKQKIGTKKMMKKKFYRKIKSSK